MDYVLLVLFMAGLYSVIGYVSSGIFQDWCWHLFDHNWEFAKAAGTVAATVWPIGWPAIIVVGLYHAAAILCKYLVKGLCKIRNSFQLVAEHFRQAEKGEQ